MFFLKLIEIKQRQYFRHCQTILKLIQKSLFCTFSIYLVKKKYVCAGESLLRCIFECILLKIPITKKCPILELLLAQNNKKNYLRKLIVENIQIFKIANNGV